MGAKPAPRLVVIFVNEAHGDGFAPAARRLGLSPPAVTRLIAGLEERLSVRLLQRTTRSVTLTDAGARYLESARQILATIADAEDTARAVQSQPMGRFVVTAPSVFGRREVAPLLCDLLIAYPAVTGELMLTDWLVNLVEEGIDVAVRIGKLEDSSVRARVVGQVRRVVVGSPGYLEAHGRPQAPSDLSVHATLHFTSLNPIPEWRFLDGGVEARIAVRPAFVTNSADAAIAMSERGAGLAMVLSYQVIDAVREGRLERVLTPFELPALPVQLVYPASHLVSANLRTFIDMTVSTRSWDFAQMDRASRTRSSRRGT